MGYTALMIAAMNGHSNVVKYMITECGNIIDINAKNNVSIFDWYLYSCVFGIVCVVCCVCCWLVTG